MARRLVALLLLALLAAAPAASGQASPSERLREIPRHVDEYGASLDTLARAPASADALQQAVSAHARVAPFLADLAPAAHELLDAYASELPGASPDDRRDLARAMNRTLANDARPVVEQWARLQTALFVGAPEAASEGVRVAVWLEGAPSSGIGAFDVEIRTQSGRVVSATVEAGQGEATTQERAARLASFDTGALLGVGSGGKPLLLGHVVLALDEPTTIEVAVMDLVDRDGNRVPAVALDDTVDPASASAAASGAWVRWAAMGAVGGLAVGAIAAARKWLKV